MRRLEGLEGADQGAGRPGLLLIERRGWRVMGLCTAGLFSLPSQKENPGPVWDSISCFDLFDGCPCYFSRHQRCLQASFGGSL